MFQGERDGWACYVDGWGNTPKSGESPIEAITACLGYSPDEAPDWIRQFSERRERELKEAPRYPCPCCRYRTVLNARRYEICPVCRWEDDPDVDWNRPDVESGPNQMSLAEGRSNFERVGVSKERLKEFARPPRPEEHPSAPP